MPRESKCHARDFIEHIGYHGERRPVYITQIQSDVEMGQNFGRRASAMFK